MECLKLFWESVSKVGIKKSKETKDENDREY